MMIGSGTYAIRPIVTLPSTLKVEKVNGQYDLMK